MGAYLGQPWRDLPNNNEYSENRREHLDFMKSYRPQNNEATHVRILLHGPVGAGKSSFINSVNSVLQSRITDLAFSDATNESTYTREYKMYKFRGDSGHYSFVFNDIMGFERTTNRGVPVEDVKLALQGHVKDGYEFVPGQSLTEGDPGYNKDPTLDDRVHVLVSVIPADSITQLSDEVVRKMRGVRQAAMAMRIPQLTIITKIDKACPKTQGNIKNAYWSKYLKQLADTFSERLGIPLKSIFLVKNYESSPKMNAETDVLILWALKQMINYGEDYLNNLTCC